MPTEGARSTTVLVVDATGRGHAICDLFVRTDPSVTVFYAGSDAIEQPRIVVVPGIDLHDPRTALAFLAAHPVDFVFVSNIDALSRGYVDVLRASGQRVIGPVAEAARLEASKERGKRFCTDHGIPTAPYRCFTDPAAAKAYVRSLPYACVVKADGLCANSDGVTVCATAGEAEAALDELARATGPAFRVLIEQRLYGTEISVFALLDGESYLLFPTALDFKRACEHDGGINCDGMGSIAPHPAESPALREQIRTTLLDPLVRGLRADGLDFTGFVYLGAMIAEGELSVLEINARFGDSEAEAVLPGVCEDFTALCRAVLARALGRRHLLTDDLVRCTVALTQGCLDPSDSGALPGWPFGPYSAGQPISGLERVEPAEATVFYANVRKDAAGRPVTCGGRVLHVVGCAPSLAQARENAYRQIDRIAFRGMRHRPDIGAKLVALGARS